MSWERLGRAKSKGGMGFKDLYCFNKALLAKQGWRLVTNPESLAAKNLKDKYYPNGDFWLANTGCRPSYAWRSILAGRELLQSGCQWRIGNGRSIAMWGDNWIPRSTTFKI